MKRRTLALLLGLVMIFGLAACGDTSEGTTDDGEQVSDTQDAEESEEGETDIYKVGETWVEEGLWEFTVTGVRTVEERNDYADTNPAAVYVVEYTYKNLGFTDPTGYSDGLYFDIGYVDSSIIDNASTMGYTYPGDVTYYPQETPVGASCNAEACIGVDNAGDFIIMINRIESDGSMHQASFLVEV